MPICWAFHVTIRQLRVLSNVLQETIELMEKCREKGLLVGRGRPMVNVLRIAPPLSMTQEHCDRMLKIFDQSLKEIEAKS